MPAIRKTFVIVVGAKGNHVRLVVQAQADGKPGLHPDRSERHEHRQAGTGSTGSGSRHSSPRKAGRYAKKGTTNSQQRLPATLANGYDGAVIGNLPIDRFMGDSMGSRMRAGLTGLAFLAFWLMAGCGTGSADGDIAAADSGGDGTGGRSDAAVPADGLIPDSGADGSAGDAGGQDSVGTGELIDGGAEADGTGVPRTTPGGLPLELPFALVRPQAGEPLTTEEIAQFTDSMTDFWKEIRYFDWVYETCHGMDVSTGKPDYLIWWHDIDAVKTGELVTFRHNKNHGGSHNNAEPTSLALDQAVGGYLLATNGTAGELVRLFANSFVAVTEGFVYDEADPLHFLMARNIITQNHEYTLPSGRKKAVDYTDWYNTYEGWNADRVHYPNNPTWGDIYVTTMRSKDDLPYMFRATAWLYYAAELAPDAAVRESAKAAIEHMEGFARDIVDSGYFIRTKDKDGKTFIPEEDLASFMDYVSMFPDAECDARLSCALLAYGEPLDNECGDGQGSPYDEIAGGINYYNYSIVDGFHMSAVQLALVRGHHEMAATLLQGLVTRLERYQDPKSEEPGKKNENWERDIATLLLEAAGLGYPLTYEEVRKIHKFYSAAVDRYSQFPNWDMWAPSVPDGTYDFWEGFHPKSGPDAIRAEEIAFLVEYCWSPFKNPAGAPVVDCERVRKAFEP